METERRKDSLWRKYLNFCELHKFKPVCISIMLVAVFIILVGNVSWSVAIASRLGASDKLIDLDLKNIGELATQAAYYTNVQVISNNRDIYGFVIPFTQSQYIFSYDGALKVGYDFKSIKITPNDSTKTILVSLPEPIIISNNIDENSLKIYNETESIFTPLKIDHISSSQKAMKEEGMKTAIDNGIYENARINAEILLTGFLASIYNPNEYAVVFE